MQKRLYDHFLFRQVDIEDDYLHYVYGDDDYETVVRDIIFETLTDRAEEADDVWLGAKK
jgi:hypothetical protein